MRFGRLIPALSVFAATGALIVLTGTGAAASQPGRSAPEASATSLAAPAALDTYLLSIGASRATVVTQRGTRNYAGPNCPGKGWTCTTSTRVLQIASDHGKNKVDCPKASVVSTSPQSCEFVQVGAKNTAKCHQRSDSSAAVQHCKITQTGQNNDAEVHQTVHADDNGSQQTATQTAEVTQHGGSNKSHVKQDVKQKAKDGSMQSQEAHQVAEIDQDATGSGDNSSQVDQDIDQSAKGSAAIQTQNTGGLPGGLPDCGPGFPFEPNACANVNQSAEEGDNRSQIKQSMKEDAKSHVVANQQQGLSNGGVEGVVHQETVGGSSSNDANQTIRQKMVARRGSTQRQVDPPRCCGVGSQVGGTGNTERIDQSSRQDASEEDAFQQLQLIGESATPSGSCAVTQDARNNSDEANNSASLSPCPFLVLTTSCTSGDSEEEQTGSCTENDPVTTPPCNAEICSEPIDALRIVRLKR